ncbi:MAG TPA: hypothetical protein VEC99_01505 [Clostridia bacterium]|nr:hypothetical protein [Clostridia bacterium]
MRNYFKVTLAIIAVQFLACALPSRADEPSPVLKVDDEHHVSACGNMQPERYRIPATSKMVLDAAGYTFKSLAERFPALKRKPLDTIRLYRHSTNQPCYQQVWEMDRTRYELSSTTLQPLSGTDPFKGFQTRERWILLLGTTYETNKLAAAWSAIIEVH